MRILFLDQFNQLGGAQQCLLDLLPAIVERGWEAIVMLPGDTLPGNGTLGDSIRKLGVEVLPITSGPYSSGYKTARDLVRFVRDVRPAAAEITRLCAERSTDIIYVNGPRLVPAAVLATVRRKSLLFHCHSYLSPRYLEWITAIPLRFAHANVAASSHFVAQPLRKWIPSGQVQIVYNGVRASDERKSRERNIRGSTMRIGVIGRIAPEKGQDIFLRTARILHRDHPDCQFVVCGAPLFSDSSYDRDIRSLAQGLPVEFTGWREDVERVIEGLDLVVVPSTPIDATPRVILQAFAAKVPVVAFANTGFKELIEDRKSGFLVTHRTPEALAAKIHELLAGDPGRLEQTAQCAWLDWRTRFSLETYQHRMIAILEQMA
jgi:glycosyltransferase involved in cell wall biosynthesis